MSPALYQPPQTLKKELAVASLSLDSKKPLESFSGTLIQAFPNTFLVADLPTLFLGTCSQCSQDTPQYQPVINTLQAHCIPLPLSPPPATPEMNQENNGFQAS